MPHALQNILLNVIFIFEKGVCRLLVGGNRTESHHSYLNVHDAVFHYFYILFERASQSKCRLWKKVHCNINMQFYLWEKNWIFALIFRKLPCPQNFLATHLQEIRNSSEIFVRLLLWLEFILQMFKVAIKNVSLKEILRLNVFTYIFFVLLLFIGKTSLSYGKILKKHFRMDSFLLKGFTFLQ